MSQNVSEKSKSSKSNQRKISRASSIESPVAVTTLQIAEPSGKLKSGEIYEAVSRGVKELFGGGHQQSTSSSSASSSKHSTNKTTFEKETGNPQPKYDESVVKKGMLMPSEEAYFVVVGNKYRYETFLRIVLSFFDGDFSDAF